MASKFGADFKQQQQLIKSLTRAECYDHKTDDISIIETHISWVILTGPYAYKIKKSLNLGFLDYSSLSLRHQYCEQELRINSRTAKDIYLQCVPISGTIEHPQVGNMEHVIEYAVKMHQFSQQDLLSHLADEKQLSAVIIDQLALSLAEFHQTIDYLDDQHSTLGTASAIWHPIEENFDQIAERMPDETTQNSLTNLMQCAEQQFSQLKSLLLKRKHHGFIRECHGDLHLGNIAYIDQQIRMFDAIEFNPGLRWIDVISELAFLCMDLEARGFSHYSYRLLNLYLQYTGDYPGLQLLRFYKLYRAMVRAKVTAISLNQASNQDDLLYEQFCRYLALATSYTQASKTCLIICHGLSGSGKSYYSQQLSENFQCIHLNSDTERKRLFGLSPLDASKQLPGQNIYSQQANTSTYQRLLDLAREVLGYGFSVIVDATFIRQPDRQAFQALAQSLSIPFIIMDLRADIDTLKQRILNRQQLADDPSEADISVMEQQLIKRETLSREEQVYAWPLISGDDCSWKQFKTHLTNLVT